MLALSGCFGSGDLALVESNLGEDLSSVDYLIGDIELNFNSDLASAEISVSQGDIDLETVDLVVEDSSLIISGLDLVPDTSYQILINLQDNEGNELIINEELKTVAHRYPQIEEKNETLFQTFYWEMNEGKYAEKYPEEADLWNLLRDRAEKFADLGITGLWLPPANKAWGGLEDVGYATYDLWDLGEFDQHGTVRTKYGTKAELEEAIDALQEVGVEVYYDSVFNHRMGSSQKEEVPLKRGGTMMAYTKFDFEGRQEYYSRADEWQWDWRAFDGVDWDAETDSKVSPRLFKGKSWDDTYDTDFLMGNDIDFENEDVVHEMKEWGDWIVNDIGFDGFRIDAIKHISSPFMEEWIAHVQENSDKDLFFVGEAWYGDVMSLIFYLGSVDIPELKVFDFPLRGAFANLRDGTLNMRTLSGAGLVNTPGYEDRSVTFLDNHDTGRDQGSYSTPILRGAEQAYTYILMRDKGVPMAYWRDYYQREMGEDLDKLFKARKYFAYGPGREVDNNDSDVYSYVREGLEDKPGTGLVMMISIGQDGEFTTKRINSGQPNTLYYDYTGNVKETVRTDADGYGDFKVVNTYEEGWSVWVPVVD